jgi:regulator of sigma E protease
MEVFLVKASQLILSLSILIVLHEAGHMIPARLFKTRVEKFYLFFDPWFSLFKFKKGDTEYGIGWIPLGGYVKISGMVDESMDKEQMKQPAQPWEFRSKPAWQRLIIMVGGVFVNLILGFLIYIMVLWVWGEEFLPNKNMKEGVHVELESLKTPGLFEEGDKFLLVGNKEIKTINEVVPMIIIEGERSVTVDRNGQEITVAISDELAASLIEHAKKPLFTPRFKAVVDTVVKNSPAMEAGLQKGDLIVGVNEFKSSYFGEISSEIRKNKDTLITLHLIRNNEPLSIEIKTKKDGTIGFSSFINKQLEFETKTYSLGESIPAGINKGVKTLTGYVQSMKLLFTKEGAGQIGGFGAIGGMFPSVWDWQSFWMLTALLSIILAFMNILPIPALDGGHVVFLLYEMITGKVPSEKVLTYAQVVGMALLLTLLLYANGMDIIRAFK